MSDQATENLKRAQYESRTLRNEIKHALNLISQSSTVQDSALEMAVQTLKLALTIPKV
jgi:hypothetical protein